MSDEYQDDDEVVEAEVLDENGNSAEDLKAILEQR